MKICIISQKYPPLKSGIGDYTKNLCVELSKEHEILLISSKEISSEKNIYPVLKGTILSDSVRILRIILMNNVSVVHFQSPENRQGLYILLTPILLRLSRQKVKIITTLHEYSDINLFWKLGMATTIIFSHRIVVVDDEYKEDIVKIHPFSKKKLFTIHSAQNTPLDINAKNIITIHSKLSNNGRYILMGFFGFLYHSKGVENILYSMHQLLLKNQLNTKLIIIGGSSEIDPEYGLMIMELIHSLKLDEWVITTGYIDDKLIADYLSSIDYFVYPFEHGYSLRNASLMASISLNKPVVTTMRKGKKPIEANGIFYLTKPSSHDELIQYILDFQDKESTLYLTDYSMLNYSWDKTAKEHLKIYFNEKFQQ